MERKTLYISDLDGTLLNSDKKVSEYSKSVLNTLMAQGMCFSIATARTAASAVKILSGVNITVPVVLMNGVVVYDIAGEKYLKTEFISAQSAGSIVNILKEYGMTGFMYTIDDGRLVTYYESLCTEALKEFHHERVTNYYKSFEQVASFKSIIADEKIIYFTLIDSYENLSLIVNDLKDCADIGSVLYKDIYAHDLWYLEIFSRHASKCNAVRYIRERCGFDRIIGFGDNFNDIPFFEACDEKYAVSNAVDELKALADAIIGDNNSDGVARCVDKLYSASFY